MKEEPKNPAELKELINSKIIKDYFPKKITLPADFFPKELQNVKKNYFFFLLNDPFCPRQANSFLSKYGLSAVKTPQSMCFDTDKITTGVQTTLYQYHLPEGIYLAFICKNERCFDLLKDSVFIKVHQKTKSSFPKKVQGKRFIPASVEAYESEYPGGLGI